MEGQRERIHIPVWGLLLSLAMLAALIFLIVAHFGEAEHFLELLQSARPVWLLGALLLQAGTYLCVALIWSRVAGASGRQLSIPVLMRLAVEKLSLDQLLPTGGMTGNLVVLTALRRLGLSSSLSSEMLLADIMSRCTAYGLAGILTAGALYFEQRLRLWTGISIGLFTLVMLLVAPAIWLILTHHGWRSAQFLLHFAPVRRAVQAFEGISVERLFSAHVMLPAALLQLGIMLLDACTLWVVIYALGNRATAAAVFIAFAAASITGIITLLPAGLGSFEAVCTTTLTALGVPVEAALTGTLLLRGFTLWLPLIPGLLLTRHEIALSAHPPKARQQT